MKRRAVEDVDLKKKLWFMADLSGWMRDRLGVISRYWVLGVNDWGERIHEVCGLVGMSVSNA